MQHSSFGADNGSTSKQLSLKTIPNEIELIGNTFKNELTTCFTDLESTDFII